MTIFHGKLFKGKCKCEGFQDQKMPILGFLKLQWPHGLKSLKIVQRKKWCQGLKGKIHKFAPRLKDKIKPKNT